MTNIGLDRPTLNLCWKGFDEDNWNYNLDLNKIVISHFSPSPPSPTSVWHYMYKICFNIFCLNRPKKNLTNFFLIFVYSTPTSGHYVLLLYCITSASIGNACWSEQWKSGRGLDREHNHIWTVRRERGSSTLFHSHSLQNIWGLSSVSLVSLRITVTILCLLARQFKK